MIEIAQSEPDMAISVGDFDHDPTTMNVLNGTLDVDTGKLHKFDRRDYITRIAPVTYVKGYRSKAWEKFMADAIPDPATREFVQAAVGYSLTTYMGEDKFFLLHGDGLNGKSTFVGALLNLMGDYGAQAATNVITGKSGTGPSNEVFVLMGKRFVSASETDESKGIREALVKQMTGGERISVNPKYRSQMEIQPTWKIWLSTNHEPVVQGGDEGIWRRLIKIPFAVKFSRLDKTIKPLLMNSLQERSGILNWAIEGYRVWKRNGLIIPTEVEEAIRGYRAEQDLIGQFINDECRLLPTATVSKRKLYTAYLDYCKRLNQRPKTMIAFGKILSQKGLSMTRSCHTRLWEGIDLSRRVSLHPANAE